MVKVTIFYSIKENDWFDVSYYLEKHLPLSKSIFGDMLKGVAIEENMETIPELDNTASFKVIGHLFFEEIEDFYNCFLPNQEILYEDGAKFTNVMPILQISKVLLWQTPWV